MVICTSPQPAPHPELLRFLRSTLGLSENALGLGLKQSQLEQAPLPVVLWLSLIHISEPTRPY